MSLETVLTVDFNIIDLSRSAQNALVFSFDASYDTFSMVNVTALQFKGRFIIKTNRTDVMEFFIIPLSFLPIGISEINR